MSVPPQLRRYQIMDQLGSGGQGRTFRAVDRETNTEVAIKVIRLGDLDGWKRFDLFERECEVLAALKHPGIPKFLDRYAVEHTGEFFLVMELIDGVPMSSLLDASGDSGGARKHPVTGEQLLELLWKALDILGYLHSRSPPVVHRDIKPQNLMRRRDGSIALIDFGGVRATLEDPEGSTVVGTFGYMAPEQLHGEATPASDIYALAATLAAIGTGVPADKLPRDGLRIALGETRLKHSPLRPVLDRMLEPVPSRRLQSVAHVRAALMKAIHGDQGDAQAGAPPNAARTSEARAPWPDPRPQPRDQALTRGEPRAPARIPEVARQLARVPAPLNILIWVWTALASGLFILLEVAMLPALYAILRTFAGSAEGRVNVARDRADAMASVRSTRRSLQYIARNTNPTRDRDRDRDEPPDDRERRRDRD